MGFRSALAARLILAVGLARGGPRGVPGLPIKAIAAILGIGERQLTNTILQHPSDYNPLADQKLIAKARHG